MLSHHTLKRKISRQIPKRVLTYKLTKCDSKINAPSKKVQKNNSKICNSIKSKSKKLKKTNKFIINTNSQKKNIFKQFKSIKTNNSCLTKNTNSQNLPNTTIYSKGFLDISLNNKNFPISKNKFKNQKSNKKFSSYTKCSELSGLKFQYKKLDFKKSVKLKPKKSFIKSNQIILRNKKCNIDIGNNSLVNNKSESDYSPSSSSSYLSLNESFASDSCILSSQTSYLSSCISSSSQYHTPNSTADESYDSYSDDSSLERLSLSPQSDSFILYSNNFNLKQFKQRKISSCINSQQGKKNNKIDKYNKKGIFEATNKSDLKNNKLFYPNSLFQSIENGNKRIESTNKEICENENINKSVNFKQFGNKILQKPTLLISELIKNIAKYLTDFELVSLSCVCKVLNKNLQNPSLWKTIHFHGLYTKPLFSHSKRKINKSSISIKSDMYKILKQPRFVNIKELDISHSIIDDESFLNAVANFCPKIEFINATGCRPDLIWDAMIKNEKKKLRTLFPYLKCFITSRFNKLVFNNVN